MTTILGRDLLVGDTVETWGFGADTVMAITPYVGPLAALWNDEARTARFARNQSGMTIEPEARFTILHRHDGR